MIRTDSQAVVTSHTPVVINLVSFDLDALCLANPCTLATTGTIVFADCDFKQGNM